MNKKVIRLITAVILLVSAGLAGKKLTKRTQPEIQVGGQKFAVEVASTAGERAQGLSDRGYLTEGHGMLFVFSQAGVYPFWMNKMKFPLDFIFINQDRVVDLAEAVDFPKAGEPPQVVTAQEEFDMVLEINAGEIQKAGLSKGDQVSWPF